MLVIVPTALAEAIYAKVDAALALVPDAASEREEMYRVLLSFFDENGYVPEFTLEKKVEEETSGKVLLANENS